MPITVTVITKPCPVCHLTDSVDMTADQFQRLSVGVEYVQDIFPDMPSDRRELLISGTHPKCWEELFSDADD